LHTCLQHFMIQELQAQCATSVPDDVLSEMVMSCHAVCRATPQFNRVRAEMVTQHRALVLEQLRHLSFLWLCLGPYGTVWQSCSAHQKTNLKGKGEALWTQLVTPFSNIAFDTEIARAARFLARHQSRNDLLKHLATCQKHFVGGARTLNRWLRLQKGTEPVCAAAS
jgi:hypothetical protein